MKSIDIKAFRKVNNLTQQELASYLGIDKGFISAIEHGKSKFPKAKLTLLLNNPHNWDTTMLIQENPQGGIHGLEVGGLLRGNQVNLRSAVESALNPEENPLVSYLERKVENQEALIYELRKQIWALEQELKSARKGENAGTADGFLSAHVI